MSTTDSPTPPAQPAVLTEIRGRVLVITLNRPDQMNAINTALAQGLLGAVRQLDEDPALTVGVLTGAGRGFCAGMDLKAFATEGGPIGMDEFIRNGAQKPLIAAIEGFALAGGLELALSCDLLVAAAGVKIGIPEVNVGLFAAGGGLLRLPRVLPYAVAMELALTADPITAEQAHSYGLVSRVSEKGGALEMAITLAERIAKNAPLGCIQATDSRQPGPNRSRVLGISEVFHGQSVYLSRCERRPCCVCSETATKLDRKVSTHVVSCHRASRECLRRR
jgi:enoyl-CoA hydratase